MAGNSRIMKSHEKPEYHYRVPTYCWIYVLFLKLSVFFIQVSNEGTYQEVVRATCGKVTGVVCEVAIAIYTFGTCIAFFIVIGDQLDRCECTYLSDWLAFLFRL